MKHSLIYACFFILLLGAFSFSVQAEGEEVLRSSVSAERSIRNNPCTGLDGTFLIHCMQSQNNMRTQSGESRRTQLLKRRTDYGRRLSALRDRKMQTKSTFDSPITPGQKVNLRERTLYRSRLLREYRGGSYDGARQNSTLPMRAIAGDRNSAILPVCSRRYGLRLIRCMEELNVDITKRTVDKYTWRVYQRMYTR